MTLQSVDLRIGDSYYRIDDPNDPTLRNALELGTLREIEFLTLPPIQGAFVSLVYTLRRSDGAQFWDSTPIAVHFHEDEIFFDGFESADMTGW